MEFEPQLTIWKRVKIHNETKGEEDRFKQALKDYEATAKDKYKTGIDIEKVHSMAELWAMIDDLAQRRKDKKGLWRKIRFAFRKLGENEKPITGWLGLVPSENNYLSLFCGGLQMILKVFPKSQNELFNSKRT